MVQRVFIHIPKTAGTMVRTALSGAGVRVGCLYPTPPYRSFAQLDAAGRAALARCPVLCGHEDYLTFSSWLGEDVEYYTLLRNPIDRVVSYYNHALTHFPRFERNKVSLLKFLELPNNYEARNLQTRYLCGRPRLEDPRPADLERACAMIESGRLQAGLQELIARSTQGWALLAPLGHPLGRERVNASDYGFTRASLTDAEVQAIREHNRLDFRLYRFCRDRVAPRATAARAG